MRVEKKLFLPLFLMRRLNTDSHVLSRLGFNIALHCISSQLWDVTLLCHFVLFFLVFCFPLNQPQHSPHLWQAAVAAAARQPQLLEGQPSNRQDQSASPVTFCLIPPLPTV